MAVYQIWAVLLAAAGWYMVGILAGQRAKIGANGMIERPTSYYTGPGLDSSGTEWKKTEDPPIPLWMVLLMAALSLGLLALVLASWSWVILVALIVLTLLFLVAWLLVTTELHLVRFVEDQREPSENGTYKITYKRQGSFPAKRDNILLGVVVAAWLLVYFILTRITAAALLQVGLLLAGLVLMVGLMYLAARRDHKEKLDFGNLYYCNRCGGKLRTKSQDRKVQENMHQSGGSIYFTERTETLLVKTCTVCGRRTEI